MEKYRNAFFFIYLFTQIYTNKSQELLKEFFAEHINDFLKDFPWKLLEGLIQYLLWNKVTSMNGKNNNAEKVIRVEDSFINDAGMASNIPSGIK